MANLAQHSKFKLSCVSGGIAWLTAMLGVLLITLVLGAPASAQSPAARGELLAALADLDSALNTFQAEAQKRPIDNTRLARALSDVESKAAAVGAWRAKFRESIGQRETIWQFAVRELAEMETWRGSDRYHPANVARLLATMRRDIRLLEGHRAYEDYASMAKVIEFGAQYINNPLGIGKSKLSDHLKSNPQLGPYVGPWLEFLEFAEAQGTDVQGQLFGEWTDRLGKANQAFKLAKLIDGIGERPDPLQPGELTNIADLLDFLGDLIPATEGGGTADFIQARSQGWSASAVELSTAPTALLPLKLYVSWMKMTVENLDLSAAVGSLSRQNIEFLRRAVENAGPNEIKSNTSKAWGIDAVEGLFSKIQPLPRLYFREAEEDQDYDYANELAAHDRPELDRWKPGASSRRIGFKASDSYSDSYVYLVAADTAENEAVTERASRRLGVPGKFRTAGQYEGAFDLTLPANPGDYDLRLYHTTCEGDLTHFPYQSCPDAPVAILPFTVRPPKPDQIPWQGTWVGQDGNVYEIAYNDATGEVTAILEEIANPDTSLRGHAIGDLMMRGRVGPESHDLEYSVRWLPEHSSRCNIAYPYWAKITSLTYENRGGKDRVSTIYDVDYISLETCEIVRRESAPYWAEKRQ